MKCKCGCKLDANCKNGFYKGHWNRNRKRPDLVKRNLENNPMWDPEVSKRAGIKPDGYIIWNKGLTKETDKRIEKYTKSRNKNISEISKKISKTKIERYKSGEIKSFWKGDDIKFIEETKKKLRISALNNVIKRGTWIAFNEKSIIFFKKLNKEYNLKGFYGQNEFRCIGYSLDFYSKKYNLVIEWDEKNHYKDGKLKEKDIIRQQRITKYLNCKFIRIRESLVDNFDFKQIEKIVNFKK